MLFTMGMALACIAETITIRQQLPTITYDLVVVCVLQEIVSRSIGDRNNLGSLYRVILKKVSFGVFRIILVSKEDKKFTIESKDIGLSLSMLS